MKKSTGAMLVTITVAMFGLGYLFIQDGSITEPTSAESIHTIQAVINNPELEKAFLDEIQGLTNLDQMVHQAHWARASDTVTSLHTELHSIILPPVEAKKGKVYEEKFHENFDELENAVKEQDSTRSLQAVKQNRQNMQELADLLGIKFSS